jgi:hypothetical protein
MEENLKGEESQDPTLETDLKIEETVAVEIEREISLKKPSNIINGLIATQTVIIVATTRIIRR